MVEHTSGLQSFGPLERADGIQELLAERSKGKTCLKKKQTAKRKSSRS